MLFSFLPVSRKRLSKKWKNKKYKPQQQHTKNIWDYKIEEMQQNYIGSIHKLIY